MQTYLNVTRQYARTLLVLFLVAPIMSFISSNIVASTMDTTDEHFKILGMDYGLVSKAPYAESTDSYKIFASIPSTKYKDLNSEINDFITREVQDFKSKVGTGLLPQGFKNQLTITSHLDYVSESSVSLTLESEDYKTNKTVITKFHSWLVVNNSRSVVYITQDNSTEISKILNIPIDAVQSKIGQPLQVGFLPNYKIRFYKNDFINFKTQYIDSELNLVPNIAKNVKNSLYQTYPDSLTLNQKSTLTKNYLTRLNIVNNVLSDCKLEKCVALTFDDGPDNINTLKVADELKSINAKATFFVLGNRVVQYPDIVKRLYNDGNEIENHTFSHPDLIKLRNPTLIKQQIDSTQKALLNIGVSAKFFRPPYGSVNPLIQKFVGMPIILWNVDAQEWRTGTSIESTVQSITSQVRNGSIVLMHDTRAITTEALTGITNDLSQRGYKFVTVSHLLGIDSSSSGIYVSAP